MIEGNCINIINLDSMTQSSRAKIYSLQLDFLSKQSNRNSDEIFRVSKTYGGAGRLENFKFPSSSGNITSRNTNFFKFQ